MTNKNMGLSIYLTNKEALAVYYTVIKHDGHLRTREKCRRHEPQATSRVVYHAGKPIESVVYCLNKTWIFDQSEHALGPIYILIGLKWAFCCMIYILT